MAQRPLRGTDAWRIAGSLFAAAVCLCLAAPAAAQMASGSFTGDGADGRSISGLGFAPEVVFLKSDESKSAVVATRASQGWAKELAQATSASQAYVASLDGDGFTVRGADEVNEAGKTIRWVAFAAEAGRLRTGSYWGIGNAGRQIDVGFRPEYVIVVPGGSHASVQRSAAMPDGISLPFEKAAGLGNAVESFTDQGFVLGNDARVNALLNSYTYVAWAADPLRTVTGAYVGDDTAARDVLDAGLRPSWALVKGEHDEEAVHLPSSLDGAARSQHFVNKANEDKDILALLAGGFRIGEDKDVNENGFTYYWTAFGNRCDPALTVSADRDTVLEGETVTLTFTLTNQGPDPVEDIDVSLGIPSGLMTVLSVEEPAVGFDPVAGTWTMARLAAGETIQEIVTARAAPGSAGRILTVDSRIEGFVGNDPAPADNADTAVIAVPYVADLAAGAAAGDLTPDPGSTVELAFSASNAGPHAATDVLGRVSLPAGLSYVSHVQTLGIYDPLAGEWIMTTLGAGAGAQLTITAGVGVDQAGRTLTSTLSLESAALDPDPADDTAAVAVTGNSADLRVVKTVDDPLPAPGGTVVFSVAVFNDGPADASLIRVDDLLPAGLSYVSAVESQGNYASGVGRWLLGDLAAGDDALLQITARVADGASGVIVNTASVALSSPADGNPANDADSATVTVQGADIAAGAAVDDPVPNVGDRVELLFTLRNAGQQDASGVTAALALPAGLTYAGHAAGHGTFVPGTGVWTVGDLAAAAACTLRVDADVDPGTAGLALVSELALAGLDQPDMDPANDSAAVAISVRAVSLSLTKNVDDPTPSQGSQVVFTLQVANAGPDVATGVAVGDTLPAGLTYVSAVADQGAYDQATGLWDVGTLAAGAAAGLDLTALVDLDVGGGDTAVNHAWIIASDQEDPDGADDHDVAVLSLASTDLALAAAVDEPAPVAGDPVRFTLTLRNDGPVDATGVSVRDTLVAGLTYLAHAPAAPSYDPATGLWSVGDLAVGAEAVLTIDAVVDADGSGRTLVTRPRVVAMDQADPDDVDNAAAATLTVQAADLELAWDLLPDPTEGDTLNARLVLHDAGPDLLQSATVSVTVPAGLTLLAAAPQTGAYGAGEWTLAGLAAGADAVLDLQLVVDAGTAGADLVLDALVTAARPGDPLPAAGPAELAVHVRGTDLAVGKAVNVSSARPGEMVIYTLSVRNDGPDAAGEVVVRDLLPAELIYQAHTPDTAAYDPGTGDWGVGGLAVGQTATLFLQAQVGAVAPGATVTNTVALLASDLAETGPGNETAAVSFTVPATDVGVILTASAPSAAVCDTVELTLTATNAGPDAASGLVLDLDLPPELLFTSYDSGFDPVQRRWVVGDLAVSASRDLRIDVRVGTAAAGDTLRLEASVGELEQGDSNPLNDVAALLLPVAENADLAVGLVADRSHAAVGDTLTWILTLANGGPSDAAGVAVRDTLPAGLALIGWTADHGAYDPDAHLWSVGPLPAAAVATLELRTLVPAGSGGSELRAAAAVSASDVGDCDAANDHAAATVQVTGADLGLETWVDLTGPGEGDDVIFTFAVSNAGPDAAAGVALLDSLPAGLTYVSHTPPGEAFGPLGDGVWRWDVGSVPTAAPRVLFLRTRVDAGTTGATLRNVAVLEPGAEEDPDLADNAVANILTVEGADLALSVALDVATAAEGDTVETLLTLSNLGPLDAGGVSVAEARDAGLEFLDAAPADAYEPGTGRWDVGALPAGETAELRLRLRVGELTGGRDLVQSAAVFQTDRIDPTPADAAAADSVAVLIPGSGRVFLDALAVADATVHPLGAATDVLRFRLVNWSVRRDTLQSLTLANAATWDGGPADLAAWADLSVWRENDGGWTLLRKLEDPASQGRTVLNGLGLVLAPGDTTVLAVRGGASAAASDGTRLALRLDGPESVGFSAPVALEADWPLATAATVVVDGFVAAQASLHDIAAGVLAPGELRRPVLDVTLPADGAAPSVLHEIQLVNMGTARPVTDVTRLEVWADTGGAGWDAGADELLGEAVWTGDRWRLSGLGRTVPMAGLRIIVTADAAAAADGQRSLRLALPRNGVDMQDGHDGPLDAALANPYTQVVGGTDRLYMAAVGRTWRVVQPDGGEELLLHLTATNTFDTARALGSLRLTGDVRSPWTDDPATLDAVVAQLVLRADADGDGIPGDDDVFLGAASLAEGMAHFGGLDWSVPPATTRHLFVSARLAPDLAADGDDVAVTVASAVDVQLEGGGEIAGAWPLDGGGGLRVDGMLARRIAVRPGSTTMAAPGATDRLVMDLRVPGNGHAADVLRSFTVENRGTAGAADLVRLRLWRDGGDDVFGGDDALLAELSPQFGIWTATGLDLAVPASGVRLYVAADLAAAARDSATVDLAVPLGGLGYASDGDGPLDRAVSAGTVLLVGDGALLADLGLTATDVVLGQDVELRLTVNNSGLTPVSGVTPTAPLQSGTGVVSVVAGPVPAAADLDPGATAVFTWTLRGAAAGDVVLTVAAAGEDPDASAVATPPISSPALRVAQPAPELILTAVSQLPFAVNGGQNGVNALTLTLRHPGDGDASAVRLDTLTVRLADGAGAPVSAAAVLDRVLLRVDGALLLAQEPATEGADVLTLVPSQPPLFVPGETAVLTLGLEVADVPPGPEFRVVLDAGGLAASDAVAGVPVGVALAVGDYPVRSELTRVVDEAADLALDLVSMSPGEAGRGQAGVALGTLSLTNPGDPELGAAIQLGVVSIALADSAGEAIAAPATVVGAVELRRGGVTLARRILAPGADSPLEIALDTPLELLPGPAQELEVVVDLQPLAPLGNVSLLVADTGDWDARDANSGVPVDVIPAAAPLLGRPVTVLEPAALAHLGGRAVGSLVLTAGAMQQAVLELDVRHPGPPGTAAVVVDSLVLRCAGPDGAPLNPAGVLAGLTVSLDGTPVGVVAAPDAPAGALHVDLGGVECRPGERVTLLIAADVRAVALVDVFALSLAAADVQVRDAHLGTVLPLTADAGAVLPLDTGDRTIRVAADELVVAARDLMPAAIAALGAPTPSLELDLTNTASATAGDLVLTGLELSAWTAGAAKAASAVGTMVSEIVVRHGDAVWARSGHLEPGDSLVTVTAESPLSVGPGDTESLTVLFLLAAELTEGSLAVGMDLDGFAVRQPEGELVAVRVLPAPGQTFPFLTRPGTVSPASLEASYSNFPNPFAAGREGTTFVFGLETAARVALRVYTPRGELVRTLLAGEDRAAGLHQDVVWDGRNGKGDAVRNGVYVAEIVVRATGGGTTTLRRNVAVVR